jgi:hypothetical protein
VSWKGLLGKFFWYNLLKVMDDNIFFAHCTILVECWAWYFNKSIAWYSKWLVSASCVSKTVFESYNHLLCNSIKNSMNMDWCNVMMKQLHLSLQLKYKLGREKKRCYRLILNFFMKQEKIVFRSKWYLLW